MKEAFEKIIERLEEETICLEDNYGDDVLCIPKSIIIEIVNQVAEEYSNSEIPNMSENLTSSDDGCKWETDFNYFSGKYKRQTGCGYTFYDLHHEEPFKICPYCGKKIKVVE